MKAKKVKRPKLVFGNYACLREWVQRTSVSDDPDIDPDILVKTAETGYDSVSSWQRDGSDWKYTHMHPCGSPVRKIESFGRLIKTYETFPLAKFLGNKDNPFWLISDQGADTMTTRCRGDLFTVLTRDFIPKQVKETGTNQFAFVPESLLNVTADHISRNWPSYVDSFVHRIEQIGSLCNRWIAAHSETAFQSVTGEYIQLGRYVGKSSVSIRDLADHITKARENLNAQRVLRKLKEK